MKLLRTILPVALALGLIVGLLVGSGASSAELVEAVRQFPPLVFAGIVGCTLFFLFLSALKWQMVMQRIAEPGIAAGGIGMLGALHYTVLGAALGLVLTPHAAMPIMRAIAARRENRGSAISAVGATFYEQLFDLVPIAAVGLAAILSLALALEFSTWLLLSMAFAAAGGIALMALLQLQMPADWLVALVPGKRRASFRNRLDWFSSPAAKMLVSPQFAMLLYAISWLRYAVLALRGWLVLYGMALGITNFDFLRSYSLVRIAALAGITPGGLGINEWTWTGVLAWLGYTIEQAVHFALANRIYNIGSTLIVLTMIWLVAMIAGRRREHLAPQQNS